MTDEAGFKIGKRTYPFPSRFRLGDPVLVEKLTGLTWLEFVDRLPEDDDAPDDPVALLGMAGVSISQGNPTWSRDRVVKYTLALGMDEVQVVGPEPEEQEDDARPPARTENGATASAQSPPPSKSDSEPPSVPSSQSISGAPV